MRILFINTFDIHGGAAIVARRLRKGLEQIHHAECHFVVANKKSADASVFETRNEFGGLIEKSIDRTFNKLGLQYQFFPFSSASILSKARELKPDVISLHNSHGGYFKTSLLKKLSAIAPVVWTLHDMWSFTGNSAHTFGDTSWKQMKNPSNLTGVYPAIGINTGEFLLRQKKKIVSESNITVVTPSRWLRDLASESPVFEGKRVVHISNGVDLDVFQPYNKTEIRSSLNIDNDARVLMFSAEQLKGNPWKGGNDLIEVLKIINTGAQAKIHLIVTGSKEKDWISDLSNFIIHRTGYINDETTMARYFSASDLFIYPTRADNLPNVLVEAIACAVPCVTFNVGGCAEIIRNDFNGVVTEASQLAMMARSALDILYDRTKRARYSTNARKHAEDNFGLKMMTDRYYNLFSSLRN